MMRYLLERARFAVFLAILSTLAGSVAIFVLSTVKMLKTIFDLFAGLLTQHPSGKIIQIISALDTFLLGIVLYIFAVALYELFIGSIQLPKWLIIKNLDDLKTKLSSVISLILAVTFLEHIVEWNDPQGTLMFAIAIALIIVSLVLYMKVKGASTTKKSSGVDEVKL